jgi:tRNA threonylcarbamoyl adenosine modification protein (Sua5/YciO/YrdC/YwlC family)
LADHLYTWINPVRESHIAQIRAVLEDDGVLAMPMDVAWAFVCDASSSKALDRLHRLKPEHPKSRPYSLVCSSISMASHICNIDDQAYRWLKKVMPGPYTVILDRHPTLARQIKDKRREVGLRIPDEPLIKSVVEALGRPLAASTLPAQESSGVEADDGFGPDHPKFGSQVMDIWGHALDMVVDLGEESPGQATTIIDLTEGAPRLVRRGAGDIAVFGL